MCCVVRDVARLERCEGQASGNGGMVINRGNHTNRKLDLLHWHFVYHKSHMKVIKEGFSKSNPWNGDVIEINR